MALEWRPRCFALLLASRTAHGSKLRYEIACQTDECEGPERHHHGMQRFYERDDFRGKRQDDDHADDQPALNAPVSASCPDRGSPGCQRPQGQDGQRDSEQYFGHHGARSKKQDHENTPHTKHCRGSQKHDGFSRFQCHDAGRPTRFLRLDLGLMKRVSHCNSLCFLLDKRQSFQTR